MEVPLPWERLLWSGRSSLPRRERYALTDFRLVSVARKSSDELAIQDIADVQRTQSALDRLLHTSTLLVHARLGRRPPFVLRHVRHGTQLAALLELIAGEPQATIDSQFIKAALSWEPRPAARRYRGAFAAAAIAGVGVFGIAIGLHGKSKDIVYAPDDAVYPGGTKRDRAAIVAFMEHDVMPWAREALAPLKGGPNRVTCETCHGRNANQREWQMPAVAALPIPEVTQTGWETYSSGMNTQMRNAIYGYLAESDNQAKAAYMREVVLPGMARLLHRPAYDFTNTYGYNRTRNAFGCYHCHRVGN